MLIIITNSIAVNECFEKGAIKIVLTESWSIETKYTARRGKDCYTERVEDENEDVFPPYGPYDHPAPDRHFYDHWQQD